MKIEDGLQESNSVSRLQFSMSLSLALSMVAAFGLCLYLWTTNSWGAGLSPDSVHYIAVARNLLRGAGAVISQQVPLVDQPPLFPFALAGISWLLQIDPIEGSRFLNAVLFGAMILLSGMLAYHTFSSNRTLGAVVIALVLIGSLPLHEISVMVWSEPLFIVIILFFLLSCKAYLRSQTDLRVVMMGLLVAVAALTRYLGVSLIGVGALLIYSPMSGNRRRHTHFMLFTGCAILPIVPWIVRNYLLSGTMLGMRAAASFTSNDNVQLVLGTITTWFVPDRVTDKPMALAGVVLAVVIILIYSLLRNPALWRDVVVIQFPLVLFVTIYIVVLLISSTTTAFDAIGTRLLAPIFIPLVLLIVSGIQLAIRPIWLSASARQIEFAALLVVFLFVGSMMPRTMNFSRQYANTGGWGYNSVIWSNNETIQWLLDNKAIVENCTIFSNDPTGIYILTGYQTEFSPAKTYYNSPVQATSLAQLKGNWPPTNEAACLVMFANTNLSWLYSGAELRTIANIELLGQTRDGQIFRVTRQAGP